MSLLPSRLDVSPSPAEPRVLDIDGEEAEAAFDALGSDTAREVLAAVYREPRTPPEVRESVGTTLQNVHYHLDRLESAGLIEPVGTGYSEKGAEMTIYGPASEAVVLFAGPDDDGSRLRERLPQLFGLVVLLAVATVAFARLQAWLAERTGSGVASGPGPQSDGGSDGAVSVEVAESATAATGMDPAVAFLLGGVVVVGAVAIWWLLRPRLRSPRSSR